MASITAALPPDLRPRLVAPDDRLFSRLLSGCLLVALTGSTLVALRVVPVEPLPAEPPRLVRDFVLPLPVPPTVEVSISTAPATPTLPPTPAGPRRPSGPPPSLDQLGLIAVLGHGDGIDAVLDDDGTPDLAAALEDSTRVRATASLGPTARGDETGRAATIGDLGLTEAPTKIELVERPSSIPRPTPPPPHVELLPEPGGEDAPSIAKLLQRRLPAIRRCYEKGITRDRALKGRLVLRFVVEEGRVQELELETATLTAISACVRTVVRGTSFPRELTSGPIEIPLVFVPADD